MKLFTTSQIRELDKYTIDNEPVTSIALMERAADRILQQFKKDWNLNRDVVVFCGPGNNGGDGLALGRMLLQIGYDVQVVLIHTGNLSLECKQNKERIQDSFPDYFIEQAKKFEPIEVSEKTIVVDALFGSGLSRQLEGIFADVVNWINSLENDKVSIDIPSGLDGEKCALPDDVIVKADITYTLQFPKLSFLFSENEAFVGKWKIVDIQLHPEAIKKTSTTYFYLDKSDIQSVIKTRSKFAHKGSFGHVFLMAGSKGMAGASVLSASAALRTGAGLVTVFGGEENREILQISVPEAIYKTDLDNIEKYSVFAFGPGIGTTEETKKIFKEMLRSNSFSPLTRERACPDSSGGQEVRSIIIDADALNLVARQKDFWNIIPKNSILTPHPKEFERLFGVCENGFERVMKARQKSQELGMVIVLKGAHTAVCCPNGDVYFNSTGNPGMATGGMGDVLTGVIAGFLAQHYSPIESALAGVFIHGLSGDLALENQSEESLLARDVIENLGKAFKILHQK